MKADWKPLAPPVKTLWVVTALLWGGFFSIAVLVFELLILARNPLWPKGLATALGFLFFFVIPLVLSLFRYRYWSWKLGEDDLAVRQGVIYRSERFIARARIQHVDIASGVISRMLNIVTVSVFVGGKLAAAAVIPGVRPEEAEELRQVLLLPESAPSGSGPLPPPLPPEGESGP
jgi:membrane protein YdbS with pleckstrin-like domain